MISYDITSEDILEYGYKYDVRTDQIEFTGFEKDDEEDLVYLVFSNGTDYLIPLTNEFTVDIGSPLTDTYGLAEGQLVEMSTDGLFVKNSNIFKIFVKRSIERGEETDISNTALSTLYAQLYVMYQQIVEQADQYATKDDLEQEVGQAVEDYIEEHPIEAPVMSVNTKTGDVVLNASDVGALPSNTQYVSSFNGSTGAVTYSAPVTSVNGEIGDVDITVPTKTSQLTNDSGYITSAPVQSVNGKTGAVSLNAADVSALPSTTVIPSKTSQLTNDSGYITSAPVTKVNNKTGNVVLTASDVGALPSTTQIPTKTSDLTNDSGFLTSAVTSFNNQTGAVTYTAPVTSVNGMTGDVVVQGGGGAVDSVNGKTGVVVLDASDVNALADDTTYVSTVNGNSGVVTVDDIYWCAYGTTTSAQIEAAIAAGKLPCVTYNNYTYTLRFRNSSTNHRFICNYGGKEYTITCQSGTWMQAGTLTFLTSAPVTSVNTKTGAVVLTASDVNALPSSTVIPSKTSDLTNDSGFLTSAVTSFNGNTGAVTYTAPVSSVNGQTGTVVLDADDVGALPDDTTYVSTFNGQSGAVTYTAPVTSVNGSTGAVVISTATTSANGLMSSTDKTHLEVVYADYSSALTALGV